MTLSSSEDEKRKVAASRCWSGYEAVPGKAPYSEDSCRPVTKKKEKKSVTEKTAELRSEAWLDLPLDKLAQQLAELHTHNAVQRSKQAAVGMLAPVAAGAALGGGLGLGSAALNPDEDERDYVNSGLYGSGLGALAGAGYGLLSNPELGRRAAQGAASFVDPAGANPLNVQIDPKQIEQARNFSDPVKQRKAIEALAKLPNVPEETRQKLLSLLSNIGTGDLGEATIQGQSRLSDYFNLANPLSNFDGQYGLSDLTGPGSALMGARGAYGLLDDVGGRILGRINSSNPNVPGGAGVNADSTRLRAQLEGLGPADLVEALKRHGAVFNEPAFKPTGDRKRDAVLKAEFDARRAEELANLRNDLLDRNRLQSILDNADMGRDVQYKPSSDFGFEMPAERLKEFSNFEASPTLDADGRRVMPSRNNGFVGELLRWLDPTGTGASSLDNGKLNAPVQGGGVWTARGQDFGNVRNIDAAKRTPSSGFVDDLVAKVTGGKVTPAASRAAREKALPSFFTPANTPSAAANYRQSKGSIPTTLKGRFLRPLGNLAAMATPLVGYLGSQQSQQASQKLRQQTGQGLNEALEIIKKLPGKVQ